MAYYYDFLALNICFGSVAFPYLECDCYHGLRISSAPKFIYRYVAGRPNYSESALNFSGIRFLSFHLITTVVMITSSTVRRS